MKAIVLEAADKPLTLKEVETPRIGKLMKFWCR